MFSGNPQTFCFVLFYNVHKENMFPIEIEDGREAPLKPRLNKYGLWVYTMFYSINNSIKGNCRRNLK